MLFYKSDYLIVIGRLESRGRLWFRSAFSGIVPYGERSVVAALNVGCKRIADDNGLIGVKSVYP